MKEPEQTNSQSSAILKELSDIKASLAVNTSETANIKGTIGEIKQVIKEIQNDAVSRREFNESSLAIRRDYGIADKTLEHEFTEALSPIKRLMYGLVGTVLLGVLGALLKLVVLK